MKVFIALLVPSLAIGATRLDVSPRTPKAKLDLTSPVTGQLATINARQSPNGITNAPSSRLAQASRRVDSQVRAADVVASAARTPVATVDPISQRAAVSLTTNSIPLASASVSASRYNGSSCGSRGSGGYSGRRGLLGLRR